MDEDQQFNRDTYHPADDFHPTRREYFAAMAMQGLLSNLDYTRMSSDQIAMDAVNSADSLIRAVDTTGNTT